MNKKVILVSCTKRKLDDGLHPAKDLYQSTWFKLARAYAEASGYDWYILSAKHGLLNPGQCIAPYDTSLHEMSAHQRKLWAVRVCEILKPVVSTDHIVEILAGNVYRQHLAELLPLDGYIISTPLIGMGIGQQQRWFKNQLGCL